jgi:membrane fusion protein, multidrug efflux system
MTEALRKGSGVISMIRTTGAVGGILGLGLLAPGCGDGGGRGSSGESPIRVAAHVVELEELEVRRGWTGRLEPLRSVAVQAPRDGRVSAVLVRDGERVAAGTVLVRMTGPDLEGRRTALEGRREELEADLGRWERLARDGAATAGEVAEARLRLLQVREQFAELEALEESYVIRAPVAGRVYGSTSGPGALATAGQNLMVVEDHDSWGVRLSVPAWEAPLFENPERLRLRDGLEMTAVHRIAFASEAAPGFVRVDLYLDGASPSRRGIEVEYRAMEEVLLVPWTAVAGEGDHHWVARIVPGDPARIERSSVELGRAHPRGVEVVSGLEAGDWVVRYEPRSHPAGRAVTPVEGGS